MKMLVFLALVGLHSAAAVMHSWKAFYTGSTGLTEFPEFVAVNLLDDEVMGYFDSRNSTFESNQSWVKENLGQQYVERQTNTLRQLQQWFKANIPIAMERFNQSKGIHVYQVMVGCEWDDETKEVNGFNQFGYDGEDFIVFDLKTETWVAPKPQSVITKHKWDKINTDYWKNYLTQTCPDWLKKYVNYGKSSLMRTELPSVSLIQKTPSSPVSCHATGFYPHRAMMFWRKDGVEFHEDVENGEILPNHDGSFQMSVDLDLSSVTPEDWRKYECVFQLSGVKNDIITKLDKREIQTNFGKTGIRSDGSSSEFPVGVVIGVVVVLLLLVAAIVGYVLWKKNKDKDGFKPANTSDTSSSSSSSSVKVPVPN